MAGPAPAPQRSQRAALLALGAVALIAIGFAVGSLVGRSQQPEIARPAADSVAVGFSQDMVVHHLQAVEMAATAYANSTDPAIRTLAYDILTGQQNQIGYMEGWLLLWDRPLRATGGYMGWMADQAGSGHSGHGAPASGAAAPSGAVPTMPGMATREELAALRAAQGAELDTLFLQLMLRHHEGGVSMLDYGARYAEVGVVRDTAAKMLALQQNESVLMTRLLAERGAQPLPMS